MTEPMDQVTKRARYREMVMAARGDKPTEPAYFEMCAAGWFPACNDRRGEWLCNPFFRCELNMAGTGLYETHFEWLEEPVPDVCLPIHPLDTEDMRWRYSAHGALAPIPRSVACRAFYTTCDPDDHRMMWFCEGVGDPPSSVVAAAIRETFPNWKIIGRGYFEPKQQTSPA